MTASTTRSARGSLLAATSLRRAACRLVLPTMTITVWSMLCCARSAVLAANVRDAATGVGMRAAHGIEFAAAGVYAGPVRGTLQYSPGQRVLCELRPARSLTGRVRLLACRRGAPLRCGLPRPSFGGDWFRHDRLRLNRLGCRERVTARNASEIKPVTEPGDADQGAFVDRSSILRASTNCYSR